MAGKRDRNIPPGVVDPERRIITNKVMQDRIHFHKYGYETNGEGLEATLWCKPGGGPPLHYHNTYKERFTAIEGDLVVELNDEKIVLKAGESAEVPIGARHRFTAEGADEIRFKGEVLPAHAGFERSLYIMYGLANDGLAGPDGLPKSPVQKALIANMSDMSFPGGTGMIMNAVIGMLAAYGRWSGEEERLLKKYWD